MPLSLSEFLVVMGLAALMALECCLAIRSRSWVQIYRPTLFIAVILAFYALVGPIRAVLSAGEAANFVGTSGTIYRELEHRPFLLWGWVGALVFYASVLAGFYLLPCKMQPKYLINGLGLNRIRAWGLLLCWIGIGMYALVHGPHLFVLLNPLAPQSADVSWFGFSGLDVGPFHNYFLLSINLLIPGIVLQFAVWLRQRKNLWVVLAWFVVASLIYLSEAFRYRILLLLIPMLLLWFFYNKRRPMLVAMLIFMVSFLSFNGLVGVARTHLRGLDLDQAAGYTPQQLIKASFEEAGVFFTTSAVIQAVPNRFPFIGFEPIATTLVHPIPRQIYPGKPAGNYSKRYTDPIYDLNHFTGVAILGYAEYYLMFGWFSVVAASFIVGVLLRRLWTWFLWRQYEPLAQSIYLLNASYLYVVVSRGYLPQIVMLYAFSILPLFCIYWGLSKSR